jgi:N-formylglutamate deformylase
MDEIYTLHRGTRPLLVSVPHAGQHIPAELLARMHPHATTVEDTDWHLDKLYDFVRDLGASLIVPRHSRYVIDLNRPPDNAPMYPGANNTELCPTRFFTGEPLYLEGQAPDPAEVQQRRATYWQPYHDALAGELTRLQAEHGHAVLFDGHSIRSQLPWLFEGRLPDLNLGTANGASCAASMRDALGQLLATQQDFTQVVDGRFKGGYITRHYGQPARGWHAVQLEMCWCCYMDEQAPFNWSPERAAGAMPLLCRMMDTLLAWQPQAGEGQA